MSITKRGEIASSLVALSFSFVCSKCGHTMTVEKELNNNKCKNCSDGIMILTGVATENTKSKEE